MHLFPFKGEQFTAPQTRAEGHDNRRSAWISSFAIRACIQQNSTFGVRHVLEPSEARVPTGAANNGTGLAALPYSSIVHPPLTFRHVSDGQMLRGCRVLSARKRRRGPSNT